MPPIALALPNELSMGTERNHAIVVTGHRKDVEMAWRRANQLADEYGLGADSMVTPVTAEATNLRCSFLVAPDGSNAGWDTSIRGDAFRDALVIWLRTQDERPALFDWVEVRFADDAEAAGVVRDSRDDDSFGW